MERHDERDGTQRPRAMLGERTWVWLTAFTLSLLIHALFFGLVAWMFPEPPGVWPGGFLGLRFLRAEGEGSHVWLLTPAESAPAPDLQRAAEPLPSEASSLPAPQGLPRAPAAPSTPSSPRPVAARPEPEPLRPSTTADAAQQTVAKAAAAGQQTPLHLSMPQVHPSPSVPPVRPRPETNPSPQAPAQPPPDAPDRSLAPSLGPPASFPAVEPDFLEPDLAQGSEQPRGNAEENKAQERHRLEEQAAERSNAHRPPLEPPGVQGGAAGEAEPSPSPSRVAHGPPQPTLPAPRAERRPAQAAEAGSLPEPEPHVAREAATRVEADAVEGPSWETASSREATSQASSAQDVAAGDTGSRMPPEAAASGKAPKAVEPETPATSVESREPGRPDEPAKPVESKEAWEAKESLGPSEASEPEKPDEPPKPKEPGEPRERQEPETLNSPQEIPAASSAELPVQPGSAAPAAFNAPEARGSTLRAEVAVETEPAVTAPSPSATETLEPHAGEGNSGTVAAGGTPIVERTADQPHQEAHAQASLQRVFTAPQPAGTQEPAPSQANEPDPAAQAIASLPLETPLGLRRALTWTPPAPIAPPEPQEEAQPDDTPPRVLERVAPVYPALARRLGIEGRVTLELALDVEGVPQDARVAESSGRADLDAAAREAALQWRFAPARRGGQPVPSEVKVVIEFRLID